MSRAKKITRSQLRQLLEEAAAKGDSTAFRAAIDKVKEAAVAVHPVSNALHDARHKIHSSETKNDDKYLGQIEKAIRHANALQDTLTEIAVEMGLDHG